MFFFAFQDSSCDTSMIAANAADAGTCELELASGENCINTPNDGFVCSDWTCLDGILSGGVCGGILCMFPACASSTSDVNVATSFICFTTARSRQKRLTMINAVCKTISTHDASHFAVARHFFYAITHATLVPCCTPFFNAITCSTLVPCFSHVRRFRADRIRDGCRRLHHGASTGCYLHPRNSRVPLLTVIVLC